MKKWFMAALLLMAFVNEAMAGVGVYTWTVNDDTQSLALQMARETARDAAQALLTNEQNIQTTAWHISTSGEMYSLFLNYAQVLRSIRAMQEMKKAYQRFDMRGYLPFLLPQIKLTVPTEVRDPRTGETMIVDKQVGSISLVAPEYQTEWKLADWLGDDDLLGGGGKGPLINIKYPHKLSDLTVDIRSVLPAGMGKEAGLNWLKAQFFEEFMEAATRFNGHSGLGDIQMLPNAAGTSSVKVVTGRLSPDQLKRWADYYSERGQIAIARARTLYAYSGVTLDNTRQMFASDEQWFKELPDRVYKEQFQMVAVAMNASHEVIDTVATLDDTNRIGRNHETDEALAHLGQVKRNGVWSNIENMSVGPGWMPNLVTKDDIGKAVSLQVRGLGTRYAHSQFEEASGIRTILVAMERQAAALNGARTTAQRGIDVYRKNADLLGGTDTARDNYRKAYKSFQSAMSQ